MVSVHIGNINELLPEIRANISSSFFVALDTEFSGLNLAGGNRESRFDNAADRYGHYRKNVSKAALLQLGLACFIPTSGQQDISNYDDDAIEDRSFKVVCYNISLAPVHLGHKKFPSKLLCAEWSSLKFLQAHEFDLHQVISQGVPYLSAAELLLLHKVLSGGLASIHANDWDSDTIRLAEAEFEGIHKLIEDKLSSDEQKLDIADFKSPVLALHYLVRQKYPNIWTRPVSWSSMTLERVTAELRGKLEREDRLLEKWVMSQCGAMGSIFNQLVAEKKVIVGYQVLQDLLFIVNSFYDQLPEDYVEFKQLFRDLFPKTFDVRIITQLLEKNPRINLMGHFESNSLKEIYGKITTASASSDLFNHAPQIIQDPRHSYYAERIKAHEAGFDAMMTGTVFIYSVFALNADMEAEARLAAMKPAAALAPEPASEDRRLRKDGLFTLHKLPPLQLKRISLDLGCVEGLQGQLSVHLSADRYVNLLGDDEQANRSKNWLRITSKPGMAPITESALLKGLLEASWLEYRILSDNEIILACTTAESAQKLADYLRAEVGCVSVEVFDSISARQNGKSVAESTKQKKVPVLVRRLLFCSLLAGICLWFSR